MFQQILDPVFGSLALSALVAVIPLATLFVMLGVFRVKAWKAALTGLALTILFAVLVWQMPPLQTLSATFEGALYGIVPILWILVNAMWVYRLTIITGWFEVLGDRVRAISNDQRILAILIAFCFGALLESLAGFGAPVAISIAMLIAAGMAPLKAAIVSLLANTAPVAFGAMAAPIIALSGVTGIDVHLLSQMAGRQTPFLAMFVPLILVFIVDGKRGLRQTWPVALVAGIAFAVSQFVTANFIAVEITDVVASVVTVIAVLVMLRFWKPATTVGFDTESGTDAVAGASGGTRSGGGTAVQVAEAVRIDRTTRSSGNLTWNAVMPYVVIIAVFSVAQIPVIKKAIAEVATLAFPWPGLSITNAAGDPVSTTYSLNVIGTGGTLLLLSGIIVALLYKVSLRDAVAAYGETLHQLRFTILTVVAVLALAYVMNFSGQTQSLGAALAATGGFFALLSPMIGWLGVAITGSDTSSNALFGLLQVTAAEKAGISPVLMAATNSSAGVLGKMLSPQNLAVAAAAASMAGKEGDLFRKLIWWSLGLLAVFTGFVYLQSTPVLGWMVPGL
ncbi:MULTISPECIES: L-lactate permease [unclassified Microbacterium]|uniref:L-lactate permease n=1 Tax=unclassified Microbacterium TaxID=2609290 RepID=UPI00214BE3F1|nr:MULTISPECIES: L-lactate permease [unclassified Microbacterium]MCR2784811.1 L-lactate permease [Microbacterium sp. zg.B96]MDL5352737.1 L-lactate permease [Microbacterium sp. zg-YB36]WIM16349.1 L-lactate permease [Microbacterium sp. zg-B96]